MERMQGRTNGTANIDDPGMLDIKPFDDLNRQLDNTLVVRNLPPCNRRKILGSRFVKLPLFDDRNLYGLFGA